MSQESNITATLWLPLEERVLNLLFIMPMTLGTHSPAGHTHSQRYVYGYSEYVPFITVSDTLALKISIKKYRSYFIM